MYFYFTYMLHMAPSFHMLLHHRLSKLKIRLFGVFLRALRAADSAYMVYGTEMYGKIHLSYKIV